MLKEELFEDDATIAECADDGPTLLSLDTAVKPANVPAPASENAIPEVHHLRIEEVMDLGDRVLARWCWHIRGLHSGVEGEQRGSVICTFRDGRVILEEFFLEHEQALKAVGLSE